MLRQYHGLKHREVKWKWRSHWNSINQVKNFLLYPFFLLHISQLYHVLILWKCIIKQLKNFKKTPREYFGTRQEHSNLSPFNTRPARKGGWDWSMFSCLVIVTSGIIQSLNKSKETTMSSSQWTTGLVALATNQRKHANLDALGKSASIWLISKSKTF